MKTGNTMLNMRILVVSILLLSASAVHSAIVYLPGTTVDFYYDDAQPGMAVYGALTAVGDSIFATPADFKAESANGGAVAFPSLGTVTVVAKSGYQFDAVSVAQQGDYRVDGAGASVSVASDLTVEDSSNAGTSETSAMTVSGLGINDGQLHEWSSIAQFDLSTATWDGVGSIDLSLDTLLSASSSVTGEYAFIQNKLTGGGLITIETVVVPVPASTWLLVSGLLGMFAAVRRKH